MSLRIQGNVQGQKVNERIPCLDMVPVVVEGLIDDLKLKGHKVYDVPASTLRKPYCKRIDFVVDGRYSPMNYIEVTNQ